MTHGLSRTGVEIFIFIQAYQSIAFTVNIK